MVRLSRQAFRTFRLGTAGRFIVARDTPPLTPFDPNTLREETDFINCIDGSYTTATSTDPRRRDGASRSLGDTQEMSTHQAVDLLSMLT